MEKADYILSSDQVFTGLKAAPEALAIAVIGNRIVAVDSRERLQSMIGENTNVYDFHDELIVPGFHDFHAHVMQGSIFENDSVKLFGSESEEEAAKAAGQFAAERPGDEWLFGLGWDHTAWETQRLPHRSSLDRYVPDRPALLFNAELHYAWVNSKALEIMAIDRRTPDPENGKLGRDEQGELTGLLFENAVGFATAIAYRLSKEKRKRLFLTFLRETAKFGVTSVNDLYGAELTTNQDDDLEIYRECEREGKLTTRIFFSPALNGDLEKIKILQEGCHSSRLALSGLKQFVDGVVTSHTAYLLLPYLDCPDTCGHSNQSAETFKEWVVAADQEGLQVRLHAIGNAAVRLALDAFEAAQKANGKRDSRHVIEHVEVLHPDDRRRFKQLGVIASFQPWHIGLLNSEAYTSRIGEEQHPCFYPIKTLADTGAEIAFGTDFPVVGLNPMIGLYHAITRKDLSGHPWGPAETLMLGDALRYYTAAPAYGSFREHDLGTLEAGKLADIVVLDQDLFSIDVEDIPGTEVRLTMMDGRVIYQPQSFSTEEPDLIK